MSDPVTNVEIEDVLSSIRRLVSQEPEAVPTRDAAKDPDALILTEDHRVDRADDLEPAPKEDEHAAPDATFVRREAATAVRSELERAIEELEASMGLADAARAEDVEMPEPVVEEPPTVSGERDDIADALDWEAPVGRAMDGPPPLAAVAEPEPEPEAPAPERAREIKRGGASSALEAIHLVSSQSDDDIYEDEEDVASVPSDRFTAPEPPYDPSKDDPFPSYGADGDIEKRLDREIAIDADLLRDMVSEIVRQELQGALGERITRNVRKLVRREINRALAGQDLI